VNTVSVVIPAFNEAERLPTTLAALHGLPGLSEVIVVDDGSTDDTAEAARRAGARVVRLAQNRGKGAALQAGTAAARGDVLLLLDADVGETAGEARKLLEPVLRGEADLVIGAFPRQEGPSGFGLAERAARWWLRRLTGRELTSPLSGQRALTRQVLEAVGGFAAGFGAEAALTVDAVRAGFRVLEVPVAMRHRKTGRTLRGFWHRARQLLHVARALAPRRRQGAARTP